MSKPERAKSIVDNMTADEFEKFAGGPLPETETTHFERWPTFDRGALYGIAGTIVELIEPHTESDCAALLLQILTGVGSMAGRNSYYAVEADKHYSNLFICAVGVSSHGRKGTALGHTYRVLTPVDEGWSQACIAGGLSSGEGLIYRVRNETRKKHPVEKRGKVVTYEERIEDHGVEDKRLLVVETEFAQALRVIHREGNTLSAILRNAWDRGNLDTLTKNPLHATGAHISIIAHITSQELLNQLSTTEAANGFANRFLWACVKRSKLLPHGGRINSVDFGSVQFRLRQAVDFARRDQAIAMDSEAAELWSELYEKLSADRLGLLGAVTSRAEAQTCRLALLYALLDSSRVIKWEHLDAAYRLWKYCEASARFIFGDRLGDPTADKILAALRKKDPVGLSRTEINALFGGHMKTGDIDAALHALLIGGFAHPIVESTGGRDIEFWMLGAEKAEKAPLG